MNNHQVCNNEVLASPAIIWQGMSTSEINKELQRLKSRQQVINRFVAHLKANPSSSIDYIEYERFCDLMLTDGVNPDLWIDSAVENIDYEIEALIENANC